MNALDIALANVLWEITPLAERIRRLERPVYFGDSGAEDGKPLVMGDVVDITTYTQTSADQTPRLVLTIKGYLLDDAQAEEERYFKVAFSGNSLGALKELDEPVALGTTLVASTLVAGYCVSPTEEALLIGVEISVPPVFQY